MKDEKKLEIKKKIREWQENLKNYKKDDFWGYEIPFANMIDLTHQAYELYGYNSKSERWEYDFTKKIINALNGMLNNEYERLNRIDNPYKYVPEEWLDDSVTAENIINEINAKWQRKDKYGKIEQEYWVEVGMNVTRKVLNMRYISDIAEIQAIITRYMVTMANLLKIVFSPFGKTSVKVRHLPVPFGTKN